jgi:hypothetical protein
MDSDLKDILIAALKKSNTSPNSIEYYSKLKKQVREVIHEYDVKIGKWSFESTDKIYKEAVALVDKDVAAVGGAALGTFGSSVPAAVERRAPPVTWIYWWT